MRIMMTINSKKNADARKYADAEKDQSYRKNREGIGNGKFR